MQDHAIAPFFARRVRAHPGWIAALVEDDLAQPRNRALLSRRLQQALTDAQSAGRAALRDFKYFELASPGARCASSWIHKPS